MDLRAFSGLVVRNEHQLKTALRSSSFNQGRQRLPP